MAEYYGVTRTSEYLAHHGIRGMKWGVRKAVEKKGTRFRSQAYMKAQKKLSRISSIGGAIGGVAGGLAKGFVGGAVGAAAGSIASGLGYYATHRKQLKSDAPLKSNTSRIQSRKKSSEVRLNSKDKSFIKGMNKSANKAGLVGALTVGGGALGGAVGAAKYIKQHPKEYAAYKKKYKQMSFKQRMRATYGLGG